MEYLDGFSSNCGTDLATELFYVGIDIGFSFSVSLSSGQNQKCRVDSGHLTKEISNFCTVGTSSMKIYSAMKHLQTIPNDKTYHHALVPEFPEFDFKYSTAMYKSEEYIVICDNSKSKNQSQSEELTCDQKNSNMCDDCNMNVCSDCVNARTCDNSCDDQKQNLVSDSSKPTVSRKIMEVQPFIHKPSVKPQTPVVKKSNTRLDSLQTKLVISPCVKLELHLEDSLLCNTDSPHRNVFSSLPKFCSTPVTLNPRRSDCGQLFSSNNESSIYTELMEAEEEEEEYGDCRRFNNVQNKCQTYSLSSSYYSVSDESSVAESYNSLDDHDIITECSKLQKQVKQPLNCSSVEILLDETQIVHDALKKYKKELDISESKFNLSHMILAEELSDSEKQSVEELKFLRSEIRKEIDIMERQLENRSKSLNDGCQNFNPLVCLEVVDKMMDLISVDC